MKNVNQQARVIDVAPSDGKFNINNTDIFDNVAVGMHWVNADGIITWANQTEMQLLGYSPDEYIGHHISEFHADKEVIEDILIRLSRNETLNLYEARLRCKDGTIRNVIINSNVLWEDDKFIHTRCFTIDVTEQKIAQRKVIESENRYRQFINGLPAAFYTCNAEGFIEFYNEASIQLWGRAPKLGIDKWCGSWKILRPDGSFLPLDECPMAIALKEGRTVSFEIIIERPDGSKSYVLPHPKAVYDAQGNITGAINTLIDITEQVEARKKIEESERQFRILANNVQNLAWMAHADGWIYWYNNRWYEYTGTKPEEMQGWGWQSVHSPDVLTAVIEKWKTSINTGNPFEMVFPLRGADGKFRTFLTRVFPVRDTEGSVVSWIGTNTDIHEQKKIEEHLEEKVKARTVQLQDANLALANKALQLVEAQQQAHIGSWEWDVLSNKIIWSDELFRIYGLTPQEFEANYENYLNYIHPDDKELVNSTVQQSLINHQPYKLIHRIITPGGSVRTIQSTGKIFTDINHNPVKLSGTAQDVTEQKKYEAELIKSEERYHLMISAVEDYAILYLNSDGTIENWNKGAEKIKGYKAEEIIGKNFSIFYTKKDLLERLPERLLDTARLNGSARHEGWRVRKDGSEFWGSIVITTLYDEQHQIIGFSKVTRDLTESKLADDKIKNDAMLLQQKNDQLEKMNKELQAFAYVSSHDLQEPLRKIQTFAARILDKELQNLSENGKDYFNRMKFAAERMQKLILDLLAYSRTSTSERNFEKTDLNLIVEEVKSELKETIEEKRAIIETNEMCDALIIPFQFRQLVYNLIGNALKFSRADVPPHIIIRSHLITLSKTNNIQLIPNKEYCHISIADNGIGFETEFSEKIFELFQRLHGKDKYEGTGIGLSIVKKIVDNHNGIITATSELNKGATFDIYLPA